VKPIPVANPPNPWASSELEYLEEIPLATVEIFEDASQSILATNDSPDLGFRFSVNPYRGCNHACAYCYARPSHEYLSFGAGTDFDTKIVVKRRAGELLRTAFEKPSWKGDLVMFSGVTDCYQPLEASLRLTRACLEVCAEYRNPVSIVTKAPLIERDLDLLLQLNEVASVHVALSIPIWDTTLARAIEPGVATPQRRIQAIQTLAKAGIPVGVMVAPIIPGVSDEGMAEVLEAASNAGARSAGYVLLRLPGHVKEVFESRIRAALPLRAEKILHRLRETRNGKLYDARFGVRGRGEGHYAEAIAQVFEVTTKRLGMNRDDDPWSVPDTFRRPPRHPPQLSLF
jgi:DNA repair photolyase